MTRELPLVKCGDDIPTVLASNLPFYEKMEAINSFILTLPSALTEPVHRFADGLYCRELPMPKDIVWVSRIHKKKHIAIISKGEVSVFSEGGFTRIKAPFTMVTMPGTQRLIYTHEDTIWTTVHATDLTAADGIETIEDALTCMHISDLELIEGD